MVPGLIFLWALLWTTFFKFLVRPTPFFPCPKVGTFLATHLTFPIILTFVSFFVLNILVPGFVLVTSIFSGGHLLLLSVGGEVVPPFAPLRRARYREFSRVPVRWSCLFRVRSIPSVFLITPLYASVRDFPDPPIFRYRGTC